MIYYPPDTVRSPRDCVDNVEVLFDGGLTTRIFTRNRHLAKGRNVLAFVGMSNEQESGK